MRTHPPRVEATLNVQLLRRVPCQTLEIANVPATNGWGASALHPAGVCEQLDGVSRISWRGEESTPGEKKGIEPARGWSRTASPRRRSRCPSDPPERPRPGPVPSREL